MKRHYDVRLSDRTEKLITFAKLMIFADEGKKLTKAAVVERLIDVGAAELGRRQEWVVPDDLFTD